jgi:HSP20 family molecular chaperone IbpA
VKFLAKNKSSEKKEAVSEKKELAVLQGKEAAPAARRRRPTALMPYTRSDLWRDFDRIFENFRSDFEDLMWPSMRPLEGALSRLPSVEVRAPYVDLEDRGKDYLLRAEMPGFKKEDVELDVTGDSVEISAATGWKYDDKTKKYLCRGRACESFYRIPWNCPKRSEPKGGGQPERRRSRNHAAQEGAQSQEESRRKIEARARTNFFLFPVT